MLLGEGAGHAFFVLVMVWCGPAYNLFLGAPSESVSSSLWCASSWGGQTNGNEVAILFVFEAYFTLGKELIANCFLATEWGRTEDGVRNGWLPHSKSWRFLITF